jgi:hypothetical protein
MATNPIQIRGIRNSKPPQMVRMVRMPRMPFSRSLKQRALNAGQGRQPIRQAILLR